MKVNKTAVINPTLKMKNLIKKMSRSSKTTTVMQTTNKTLKMATIVKIVLPKRWRATQTSPISFILP
jgi:hypothetical protein